MPILIAAAAALALAGILAGITAMDQRGWLDPAPESEHPAGGS